MRELLKPLPSMMLGKKIAAVAAAAAAVVGVAGMLEVEGLRLPQPCGQTAVLYLVDTGEMVDTDGELFDTDGEREDDGDEAEAEDGDKEERSSLGMKRLREVGGCSRWGFLVDRRMAFLTP